MKGVLVIIDGLGDLPHSKLEDKTPLEAAKTPNLDILSEKGELGYMYPIKENLVPGTSEGVVSIFGQNWRDYPRGWIEALGADLDLRRGDLALRANFATIDNLKNRRVIDRRVGRNLTTKEVIKLTKEINDKVDLPCDFIFKNTLQHRAVLVLKGGLSDAITNTDPEYSGFRGIESDKFRFSKAENDDEVTEFTVNALNNFLEQSHKVLNKHLINIERKKKGFYPANIILTRSPGTEAKKITKFKKWACSTSVPCMKGVCKVLGVNLFKLSIPAFKGGDTYKNFYKHLSYEIKKSISSIWWKEKKFDYFLLYLKEVDSAGHDNKPIIKKEMIEFIDKKLFGYLRKFCEKKKIKIVVTADHSTPCKLKKHSADPVPVLFCDWQGKEKKKFCEKEAREGKLGRIIGKNLLKKVGFVR